MARAILLDKNDCKSCARCKKVLTADMFFRSAKSASGLSSYCKECGTLVRKESDQRFREKDPEGWALRHYNYQKKYQENNPQRFKEITRSSNIKKHGITLDQYNELLESQDGSCAICRGSSGVSEEIPLSVDHDHSCCPGKHSCGKCIRGLLCFKCNAGLGGLEDYLKEAEEYLNANCIIRK